MARDTCPSPTHPVRYLSTAFLIWQVRRFFDGGAASDGRVVRWLPAEGDDFALWHMVHDDGDEEDLEEDEVMDH